MTFQTGGWHCSFQMFLGDLWVLPSQCGWSKSLAHAKMNWNFCILFNTTQQSTHHWMISHVFSAISCNLGDQSYGKSLKALPTVHTYQWNVWQHCSWNAELFDLQVIVWYMVDSAVWRLVLGTAPGLFAPPIQHKEASYHWMMSVYFTFCVGFSAAWILTKLFFIVL